MKVNIRYKKNPHQKEFHNDISTKLLDMSSGFGGGKSHAIVMKSLQLSWLNRPFPGGCLNPSIADYKKDLEPLFEEILEENNIRYTYHKTDKWFRFPWSKGRLYIASAEKKLRGPNWSYATINEIGLIPWVRYQEVLGRVRIKNSRHPQIASSGTPEGTAHWTYEKFVEDPMTNSRIIYGDTRNNIANLSEDYIRTLEETYDATMLDAYLRGLFVNMTSNRFYYSYDPAKNDDESICHDPNKEVHVSMDFNVDPMTATIWHVENIVSKRGIYQIDLHGRPMFKMQAFDQIELGGAMGANTSEMARALIARGYLPHMTTIYPDPAGKARSTQGKPDHTILRDHGFTDIRVKNSAPQFRTRQLSHNNLLDKGYIKIHPKKCKGLKRDYESVEQDIVSLGKIKKNPKLTHHSDGADYMFDIIYPLSGKKPNSRSVKYR